MARPIKTGLDYFPLDVDIFEDPKLLFVEDRFDVKGEIVTIKLLCWIYRNGYFCEWNDEHALIFAKKNFSSIKASLCIDVVNELLKRGFFNKDIFETFGVLTSAAIQERWKKVVDLSKRKARLNPELNLLTQEETKPEKELTTSETDESTQSKVKESKVKESIKKIDKKNTPPDFLDFQNYALENHKNVDPIKLELKYKSWIVNGWKTGKNKKINNWKTTLLNTLPYLEKEKSSAKKEKDEPRINRQTESTIRSNSRGW